MSGVLAGAPARAGTAPGRDTRRGSGTLAGAGTLYRFALRRDRVRLPAWVLALLLGTLVPAAKFEGLYPEAHDRAAAAETMSSPAARAMTGPEHFLDGAYTVGAMIGHQMLGFLGVLVGLMSVLLVVRHSREEEETGRAELVRSCVVGRHAALTAALGVAATASLAVGLLLALLLPGLGVDGVDASGALVYGAAHTVLGLAFAGVTAVTVQFTAHTRAASGAALAVVGAAYALRAAGDVGADALSWLSPLGWAQRSYPFVDDRVWPLLLTLAFAAAVAGCGYLLSTRRDVGAGLRASRPGPARAGAALGHPLGLALRLQRGLLAGFAAALVLLGVVYGSILGDVEDMLGEVEQVRRALAAMGGSVTESFASTVMIVLAVVAAVYAVMATLRPRAEEAAGRAEPLLATALSRSRWAGGHLAVAAAGGTLVLLAGGLGFGAAGAASTGDASLVLELAGSALAYAPAVWVTAGLALLLYGWAPRAAGAAWVVPLYGFLVGYLGSLLDFPDGMNNLSPFGHVPRLPLADVELLPLVLLTALAAVLSAAGLWGLRRRDLRLT